MSHDPNGAPDANLRRARKKFDELSTIVSAYLASNPYTYRRVSTNYRDTPAYAFIIRREKDPPDDIAFDVVDVARPLRSALDKAIHNVVVKNGRGAAGVGFPFGRLASQGSPPHRQTIYLTISDGDAHKALRNKLTAEQWSLIEELEPWPGPGLGLGGNNRAWALNELANIDKHRGDIVRATFSHRRNAAAGNGMIDFMIGRPDGLDHLLTDTSREHVSVVLGWQAMRCVNFSMTCDLQFDNVPGVYEQPVLPTSAYQIAWAEDAVETLRPFF